MGEIKQNKHNIQTLKKVKQEKNNDTLGMKNLIPRVVMQFYLNIYFLIR